MESISSAEGQTEAELVHRYDRGPAVLFAVARTTNVGDELDDAAESIREMQKRVRAGLFRGVRNLPSDCDRCGDAWGTAATEKDQTAVCSADGAGDAESPCPVDPARTLWKGLSVAIVSWPDLITSMESALEGFVTHEANQRSLTQGGYFQGDRRVNINPLAFGDTVAFATSDGTTRHAASRIAHDLRRAAPLGEICRDQARREAEDNPDQTAIVALIQFTRIADALSPRMG